MERGIEASVALMYATVAQKKTLERFRAFIERSCTNQNMGNMHSQRLSKESNPGECERELHMVSGH